ncbi:hypothetical protein [Salmonirosea aquatica]|uniref:Uncharacterized protein n=1 Tax=Salmonirosea aquatica TaxID=2654236 RepID=A0A7C9BE65_9BACT|nr:hypothetical protein [Cytophagaceae bacterium SJW1-29]
MIEYLKDLISKKTAKKKARRHTQEYGHTIDAFQMAEEGEIRFANWKNPLIPPRFLPNRK